MSDVFRKAVNLPGRWRSGAVVEEQGLSSLCHIERWNIFILLDWSIFKAVSAFWAFHIH